MVHAPVLVTGAAGFVGARFVESLNRRQQPVLSVDGAALFSTRPEHAGVDFGRVVDTDELFEALANGSVETPSAVVHLGACTDTTELDEDYLRRVNLEYSQGLWNLCADHGLPFVYASSAATYGDGTRGWDDDEARFDELEPLNPYGESKRLFDVWALEQERAGRTPSSWAGFKFFNVYGFGERHKDKMSSVVLQAFDQIRSRGTVRLFQSHKDGVADGEQLRDFVFVDDVVDVLHFALEQPIPRGVYNLGTGTARTFLDLARATFKALDAPENIEFIPTPEHLRARYQYFTEATMGKLRAAGYDKPFTSLEDGVAAYVARLLAAGQAVERA